MGLKTKIFQTSKAKLLCVDLPEGATFELEYDRVYEYYYLEWRTNYGYDCFDFPQGNWQLLGRREDVSEDIAEKIVESRECTGYDYNGITFHTFYRNYQEPESLFVLNADQCNSASESFQSLIAANICTVNPYHPNNREGYPAKFENMPIDEYNKAWREAEAQVFRNPVLFWEPIK